MEKLYNINSLNVLPVLQSFLKLKFGDKIFSRKFGIGKILWLHNKEVVVQFSNQRLRIDPGESDISLIPKELLRKPKSMNVGYVDGEKMSITKMRNLMRQKAKDCVPVNQASKLLSIKKENLIKLCEENKINICQFGIYRVDLLKISKFLK